MPIGISYAHRLEHTVLFFFYLSSLICIAVLYYAITIHSHLLYSIHWIIPRNYQTIVQVSVPECTHCVNWRTFETGQEADKMMKKPKTHTYIYRLEEEERM